MEDFEKPVNENESGPERFPSKEDVLAFIDDVVLERLVSKGTIQNKEHQVIGEREDEQGLKRYEIEVTGGVGVEYQRNNAGRCTIDIITYDNEIPFAIHFATYKEGVWEKV